jgi:serine/threonine protein kinase
MDVGAALGELFGSVELLHEDGVSQVFRVEDAPVAVKVCSWPTRGEKDFTRFAEEVRHVTKLSEGGCLVPLLGSGFVGDGHAYVAMRWCAGGSIDRYLPLPVDAACEVVATIGQAVAGLHAAGAVHGRITPRKILLDRDGMPRLGLFGVDAVARPSPYVVINGTISIAYHAPEVLSGLRLDPTQHRADVFSLGAVLYALLTGRPPHFPPDRDLSIHEEFKLIGAPPPPHPAVPSELLTVIRRAMRHEARERHRDVAELVEEIARFRSVQ